MKIKSLTLQNYKRFVKPKTISFENSSGEINDVSLIIGDNGSGKTSILQAIVMLLGTIIRENFNPEKLEWAGFEYRNLQSGKLPLKIEAEILFDEKEIAATQKYAKQLSDMGIKLGKPASNQLVTVFFDYKTAKTITKGDERTFFQFTGYQYAKRLTKQTPKINKLFEDVGNIYWYTEQRTSDNITNLLDNKSPKLDDIRSFLASAYNYHIAIQTKRRNMVEGEFDFYEQLKKLYESVFTDRTFAGTSPRFDIYENARAPDFFLSDQHNQQYEISGMSAGERAIFPILMDFARWSINNSIIIIDELELHLHPPLQQTLIRALSKIGHNNQFIFTTYANSVVSMFSEEENQIIRLTNE